MKAETISSVPQCAHENNTVAVAIASPSNDSLTYSVDETAVKIGVSKASVYRLLARRLLRPVGGLRHKRIARKQVHAFIEGGPSHE